jgi:hypothetical protein
MEELGIKEPKKLVGKGGASGTSASPFSKDVDALGIPTNLDMYSRLKTGAGVGILGDSGRVYQG